MEVILDQIQHIIFIRSSTDYNNGVAKRPIKTEAYMAKTMLIHDTKKIPKGTRHPNFDICPCNTPSVYTTVLQNRTLSCLHFRYAPVISLHHTRNFSENVMCLVIQHMYWNPS